MSAKLKLLVVAFGQPYFRCPHTRSVQLFARRAFIEGSENEKFPTANTFEVLDCVDMLLVAQLFARIPRHAFREESWSSESYF